MPTNQEYVWVQKENKTTKDTKGHEVEFDELSNRVIGCAIAVHRALGPGRLESAHEQCLARELALADIQFQVQAPVPVEYKPRGIK